MSSLTRCNYCQLQRIRRRYPEAITQLSQRMPGWIEVVAPDEPDPLAYFVALPDSCVC